MLDNKTNTLSLEIISSKFYDDVIAHLRKTFFADEPLNKAVNLCTPGNGHPLLEQHSLTTLKDNLSVMAITKDGEIAGVALNGVLHSGDTEDSLEKLETIEDLRFKKIFKLLYEENSKINLFKQFEVDKIFEIRILSVDSKFRGQGLAKKLMIKSQEVALEKDFKLMKTDATGVFSQKVSSSLGFETISEIQYDSYQDENGEIVFEVEPPHENLKIMFKKLD